MMMLKSTTVQPSDVRRKSRRLTEMKIQQVSRLVKCGGDEDVANQLVERLTKGTPVNIYEEAAVKSFIDLVATLSNSGGRLTSVS